MRLWVKLAKEVFFLMICVSGIQGSAWAISPRLLLGSGGFFGNEKTAEYLANEVDEFLGSSVDEVLVIPYAASDYDKVFERIKKTNLFGNRRYQSIHVTDPVQAAKKAKAFFVFGGNTFKLLNTLYEHSLLEPIRKKVLEDGIPYIGVSAGINIVCPTIKTTNDMPIVQPPSFAALNLVPFQINPHYVDTAFYSKKEDGDFEKYAGETRDDRIREFLTLNQVAVVGIPEATFLKMENGKLTFHNREDKTGNKKPARHFSPDREIKDYAHQSELSHLL